MGGNVYTLPIAIHQALCNRLVGKPEDDRCKTRVRGCEGARVRGCEGVVKDLFIPHSLFVFTSQIGKYSISFARGSNKIATYFTSSWRSSVLVTEYHTIGISWAESRSTGGAFHRTSGLIWLHS